MYLQYQAVAKLQLITSVDSCDSHKSRPSIGTAKDLALDQDFHTSKRINRNFSMIVSTLTKSVNFSFKDQENAAFYMLK
ncbi:unnamed protein product [Citrullus colocynthis]|uniref:Uncharacterized protein n=1 Tax=Citrullus colocynthis TaxID=252529 RepID=A0ABP0Y8F5_9ROSI